MYNILKTSDKVYQTVLKLSIVLSIVNVCASVNELDTSVIFCYFHLPTINTTMVINKLRHLSYYCH